MNPVFRFRSPMSVVVFFSQMPPAKLPAIHVHMYVCMYVCVHIYERNCLSEGIVVCSEFVLTRISNIS